jgi:hypothetical protein
MLSNVSKAQQLQKDMSPIDALHLILHLYCNHCDTPIVRPFRARHSHSIRLSLYSQTRSLISPLFGLVNLWVMPPCAI